jgi:hypothetical protein
MPDKQKSLRNFPVSGTDREFLTDCIAETFGELVFDSFKMIDHQKSAKFVLRPTDRRGRKDGIK